MNFLKIKKLGDIKEMPDDINTLYQIAYDCGLYDLWLDDTSYLLLPNFLKYRFGIVVRQGYVFCKNDFACRLIVEFTNIPYEKIIVMKGLFK